MSATDWTAGDGEGQTVRVEVHATSRNGDGYSAIILDTGTEQVIGGSMQFDDEAAARKDGARLVKAWWPKATVTLAWDSKQAEAAADVAEARADANAVEADGQVDAESLLDEAGRGDA